MEDEQASAASLHSMLEGKNNGAGILGASSNKGGPPGTKKTTQSTPLKMHFGVPIDPTEAVKALFPKIEVKITAGIEAGIKTPFATVNFAPLAVDIVKINADADAKTSSETFFNSTKDFMTGIVTTTKTSDVESTLGVSAFQSGAEVGQTQKIDAGLNSTESSTHTQYSLFGATNRTDYQNNQLSTSKGVTFEFGASFLIGVEFKISFGRQ